jgi:REP element-mobilizing transposase RayT
MTFHSIHDPTHLYFVTASVVEWIPLFKYPKYTEVILSSLSWMQKEKRLLLFAFVIMPTHAHLLIKPQNQTIGETVQQFGSFTAHEILKKVREDGKTDWLKTFEQEKRDPRHKHSIWQDIQAKNIFSMEVLEQKVEYIHQNPIRKDWKLATDRADYIYSSAGYYDYGRKPIIEIADINEWLASTPPPGTVEGAG